MPHKPSLPDLAVGACVLVLGALALWQAGAIPASPIYSAVGPKLVPYLVGAALLVLGGLLALAGLRGGWSHGLEDQQDLAERKPVEWRSAALLGFGLLVWLALPAPPWLHLPAGLVPILLVLAGPLAWPPEPEGSPRTSWRPILLLLTGLGANLLLIGPYGFALAAAVQFVLVAAAFGSRHLLRDAVLALVLCLLVWFGFVELLGVNIGAGVLEGAILRALGQEVP